jgi:predicted secreted protein
VSFYSEAPAEYLKPGLRKRINETKYANIFTGTTNRAGYDRVKTIKRPFKGEEMKKLTFGAICILLVTMALAGCGGGTTATYTGDDSAITAKVGEQFIIILEGNETTGYTWMEGFNNDALKMVKKEYKPDEQAKDMVGGGGASYFTFKGLQTGTSTITMTYKQPWENRADDKVKEFTVTVE